MSCKETKKVIKELKKQDYHVELGKAGHYKVWNPAGRLVTTMPSSPGRGRGLQNRIADLRRAGFIWKGR